ncbi:DUF2142 domain-containing protein [Curtobacterium sp. ODYSSEY 48 V2]|uniref:DUF2142 domain-containing protein n=1 Tax=Curtobacterium sp. ODYSSEY 48 V2 TaxID=2939561 RepID=UPI00204058FF|nr:DUF2142 domain-containing protein [Curtobacterium sp. ODYSSEY 48 V2]MCM3506245.1 DUF2142 domain-containing protein [Curtobacterium sp. ODYSSEY 48 V2]
MSTGTERRAVTDGAVPPVSRRELVAVAVVTTAFALWLGVWAMVVPAFQAPDETAHVDAAVHLALGEPWVDPGDLRVLNAVQAAVAQQDGVPHDERSTFSELLAGAPGASGTVNQMTQHPPTAYAAYALVLRAVDYGDLRWDQALLVLRLVDAAVVAPLAVLAWATVRRLTRSPRAGLVGALALFATPQLASIASSVSNDAPVLLLSGVVVWIVTRVLTGDVRLRTLVSLGLVLSLLVWTKGTGLPAVPFVGLAAFIGGAGAATLRTRVVRAAVPLVICAALGSWWWLHNLVAYGRVQPNGYSAIRGPQDFPPGEGPSVLHFLDVSWGTLTRTFWGSPGMRAQVSIGDLLTALLTVVTVAVVALFAFRAGPLRRPAVVLAVFPALLVVVQTATSARGYLTTTEVAATQGRYYFPALLCLVALSAVAWRRLARRVHGRALVTGLAVGLPAVGAYGLVVVGNWFWNAAELLPTAAGSERFRTFAPVPPVVVGIVVACVAVGVVVTVLAISRQRYLAASSPDVGGATT